jgi:hypothetical protein
MFIASQNPAGALEALAGDTGATDTAEEGGFRGADVIAVEAGDREGLEDVEFDEVHGSLVVVVGL